MSGLLKDSLLQPPVRYPRTSPDLARHLPKAIDYVSNSITMPNMQSVRNAQAHSARDSRRAPSNAGAMFCRPDAA